MSCNCNNVPCKCPSCASCRNKIWACTCQFTGTSSQNNVSIMNRSNQSMTFGPGDGKIDPFIESSTGIISIKAKLDYGTLNLIEMYLQGKDFETHKEEYVDSILKLPWVDGNNLKACQTFERLKQLFSVFGGKE